MIAVLGSINLDFVASSSRLPSAGETIAGTSFVVSPGGKGANQCLAVRRAGSEVIMAGAVGEDNHASAALENLTEAGVDLTGVKPKAGSTGIASIFLGGAGENMILSIPGANGTVGLDSVDELMGELRNGDSLIVQLEIPGSTVRYAIQEANARGITTILNTAPFTNDAIELSKIADVVVMNESEMAEAMHQLKRHGGSIETLYNLLNDRAGKLLVITKGKDGAVSFDGTTLTSVPAPLVKPVDTVGAGDTFVGYFAAALAQKVKIGVALQRATVAASLACLKHGAQPGIPVSADVEHHIETQRSPSNANAVTSNI